LSKGKRVGERDARSKSKIGAVVVLESRRSRLIYRLISYAIQPKRRKPLRKEEESISPLTPTSNLPHSTCQKYKKKKKKKKKNHSQKYSPELPKNPPSVTNVNRAYIFSPIPHSDAT